MEVKFGLQHIFLFDFFPLYLILGASPNERNIPEPHRRMHLANEPSKKQSKQPICFWIVSLVFRRSSRPVYYDFTTLSYPSQRSSKESVSLAVLLEQQYLLLATLFIFFSTMKREHGPHVDYLPSAPTDHVTSSRVSSLLNLSPAKSRFKISALANTPRCLSRA